MQPVSYTRCPLGQHCNPCSVSRCLFLWPSSIGLVLTRLLEGIGHNLSPSPRLLRFLVSFEITSCTSGTESTTSLSLSLFLPPFFSLFFLSACPLGTCSRYVSLLFHTASSTLQKSFSPCAAARPKGNRLLSTAASRVIAEEKTLCGRSEDGAEKRWTKGEETARQQLAALASRRLLICN